MEKKMDLLMADQYNKNDKDRQMGQVTPKKYSKLEKPHVNTCTIRRKLEAACRKTLQNLLYFFAAHIIST